MRNQLQNTNNQTKDVFNIPFDIKSVHEDDENDIIFEGYASTFGNIDLDDDIIERGAFANSLSKNPSVAILWQHSMSIPIGASFHLIEDTKGLFIRGKLPRDDSFVRERVMPQMRIGSIKEMSIGFRIINAEMKTIDGKEIRVITEIDLFEISLVTKAANPEARIISFTKSFVPEFLIKKEEKSNNQETQNKAIEDIKSVRDLEKYLKSKGLSQSESKCITSKIKDIQRDVVADESQRDVGNELEDIKQYQELVNIKNLLII